jgi:hypothetical protein
MNVSSVLKKKYEQHLRRRPGRTKEKRQLNMVVREGSIKDIKRLAAQFSVPRYAIGQHALDVGTFYLDRALNDEKKKELIREHLIDSHMLDSGQQDGEVILRICESGYGSQLILLSKGVMKRLRALRSAIPEAKRTLDFRKYDYYREELLKSALQLAYWIENHPLDETADGEPPARPERPYSGRLQL